MNENFDFSIRSLEQADVDQVYQIEQDLFSLPWTRKDFCDSIENENNIYLIIEKNGIIVGYCGLWGILEEGQINNIAIKREYQNHKLGHHILKELIKNGQKKGLKSFTLEVRESNKNAIHLYENLGFTSMGKRTGFYDYPKEDALIMWLYC